ncbi:leucine-rich repeat domain-containing protein [Enterococcus sp. FDAARGOS_553]|uniref:leucine-rich repeat domain-containing protein n=1 Tax=Enterococcus sp. FDAARGOS_553 TaxID=2420313 RepID=UPI000F511C87|nr:leucine-rich repeat domain-containing protein [Enterococcus sp. FDAARGOS_553]AYY09713.1 leucine-rich repeat domain-containing protein [Enterococcus sp. FDAARGOS_553]
MTNGTSQGLFVVVAIIIFGIFILISYLLFRDTLKPSLANIFTDGLEQANTALNNGSIIENNINTDEKNTNIYNNQLYVKIRDKNESKNETEVWVLLEELKDDTYAIKASGIKNTSPTYNINNPSYSGSTSMTGDLILPDTINGKKITLIKEYAFCFSMFNGQLTLPKYLQSIGNQAFNNSKFSGSLTLPDSLQSIGGFAFYLSKFSGTLDISNVTNIGAYAFWNSSISTVKNDSLDNKNKTIGSKAIKMADGSYYSIN